MKLLLLLLNNLKHELLKKNTDHYQLIRKVIVI